VTAEQIESTFGIGAVSRLTGIPLDTLRIWERRYGVVVPRRSNQNRRFYTRDDVSRLLLVKQLVDQGEPIGSVARWSDAELNQSVQAHAELQQRGAMSSRAPERDATEQPQTLLVYGEALPYQLQHWQSRLPGLSVLGACVSYEDFRRRCRTERADIVLLEFPALQGEALSQIRDVLADVSPARVIVVYAFAARGLLARLAQLNVKTVKAPLTAETLLELCRVPRASAPEMNAGIQPSPRPWLRRFTGRELAEIASLESRLTCECPQHLADLVARLNAFEQYSLSCEQRNDRDAAIHARLYEMTAQARLMLEEALGFLLEQEGILLTGDEIAASRRGRAAASRTSVLS
jgi:DNA-binding transcriptional MerR regulator